jgi:outer membrane biosynthesis protein TonB
VSVTIDQSSGFSTLDRAAQKQVASLYRFKVGNSRVLRIPIAFQLD